MRSAEADTLKSSSWAGHLPKDGAIAVPPAPHPRSRRGPCPNPRATTGLEPAEEHSGGAEKLETVMARLSPEGDTAEHERRHLLSLERG